MNQPSTPNSLIEGFPPLPVPADRLLNKFSADQMQAHAVACVLADRAPAAPVVAESIASNHDAMIILTQGYSREDVIKVVDAHTARQIGKVAPVVAEGLAELRKGLLKVNRSHDVEHLIHQVDALAAHPVAGSPAEDGLDEAKALAKFRSNLDIKYGAAEPMPASEAVKKSDDRYRVGYSTGWDEGRRACPKYEHMGEHACIDKSQCWEPCGELGKSAEHARTTAAPVPASEAANVPIGYISEGAIKHALAQGHGVSAYIQAGKPTAEHAVAIYLAAPAAPTDTNQERADFEHWYLTHIEGAKLGSADCAARWSTWLARSGGFYKAPSDWKIAPMPWSATAAPTDAKPDVSANFSAQFNGFDIAKLPPILISCVAKLWPGSNGLFWELALEKMPERIEQLLSTSAQSVRDAAQPCREPTAEDRHADAMAKLMASAQPTIAAEEVRNAARYRVLRRHVSPRDVSITMDVPVTQIPANQTIEERIDMLCDQFVANASTTTTQKEGA